jgi:hypothetical protein
MIPQTKSVILNQIVKNVLFGSGFKKVEKFAFSNGRQLSAFLKCTILNAKMQFYEIVNCVF